MARELYCTERLATDCEDKASVPRSKPRTRSPCFLAPSASVDQCYHNSITLSMFVGINSYHSLHLHLHKVNLYSRQTPCCRTRLLSLVSGARAAWHSTTVASLPHTLLTTTVVCGYDSPVFPRQHRLPIHTSAHLSRQPSRVTLGSSIPRGSASLVIPPPRRRSPRLERKRGIVCRCIS